jgi:predicted XRE-type DNA-binding protein
LSDLAAQYWTKGITRREAQAAFDEYAALMLQFQERLIKLDLTLAYVAEKLGITQEEFQAFINKKLEEFSKAQAQQAQEIPSIVTP